MSPAPAARTRFLFFRVFAGGLELLPDLEHGDWSSLCHGVKGGQRSSRAELGGCPTARTQQLEVRWAVRCACAHERAGTTLHTP